MFLFSCCDYTPARYAITCAELKCINKGSCSGFIVQTFVRAATKVVENISHSSCTSNGDHVGLLIKTGTTQKKRMIIQTIISIFQSFSGKK